MARTLTERQEIVLAVLAAESGGQFAPVQVQKLFFLLDENVADGLGGRQFNFEPYDYGPFDKAVYHELEALEQRGLVQIHTNGQIAGRRLYSLTAEGERLGTARLAKFPSQVQEYMSTVSRWVRDLSFAQLVGAIYQAYPHMKENSIFRG